MADDDDDGGGGGAGWLVSYADLMTLLFATFVVLYGIKPEGKTVAFVGVASSIREAFREVPDNIPLEAKRGPIILGVDVFKFWKGNAHSPPVVQKKADTEFAMSIVKKDMDRVRSMLEALSVKVLNSDVRGKDRKSVDVDRMDGGFKVTLASSVFYKEGQYKVRQKQLNELLPVIQVIKELNQDISVEGHTDTIPPKSGIGNWQLSTLRATHLVRYLVDKAGFSPDKISGAGYADKRPLFLDPSPESRAANHRVEIKVRYTD